MKKRGFVETIVKAGILVAGIGGTLYLLKDKMEENPKYKEAIDKAKDKIKKHTSPEVTDDFDVMDDVEDFDDIVGASSDNSSERGYVTIKLHDDVEETTENEEA